MKKQSIIILVAASLLLAGNASAAVLLATDFTGVSRNNTTNTASNITWTTNGLTLASPDLVFSHGFINTGGNAPDNNIRVNRNVETAGPWSTSFTITPAVALELDNFTLFYRAINVNGFNQLNVKDANVALNVYQGADVTGTLLGTFSDIVVDPGGPNSNNAGSGDTADIDLSSLAALTIGQAYTFELTTSSHTTTGGNNWAIDNLTLNGIPEPSAALLGGLGFLFLLRRRQR